MGAILIVFRGQLVPNCRRGSVLIGRRIAGHSVKAAAAIGILYALALLWLREHR